jgi:hypothetical protein
MSALDRQADIDQMRIVLKERDDANERWTAALQLVRAKAEEWERADDDCPVTDFKYMSLAARTLLQEIEQLEK